MNSDEALTIIKDHLPEKRYIHTIGVYETAKKLAEQYGASVKKAELAAIFHDYAKYRPVEEMRAIILRENFPRDLLDFHPELWHAPVGAWLVREEQGIEDEEILNAIKYHTTGRANMTTLEKIIYLADYIEPNRRSFPGLEEVRKLAEVDLDRAVFQCTKNSIEYLLSKNATIYPDTIHTYNSFLLKRRDSV